MSHEGKLRRGKKYYDRRNQDGEVPKEVLDNPDMKDDLEYYLDSIKKEEPKAKKVK